MFEISFAFCYIIPIDLNVVFFRHQFITKEPEHADYINNICWYHDILQHFTESSMGFGEFVSFGGLAIFRSNLIDLIFSKGHIHQIDISDHFNWILLASRFSYANKLKCCNAGKTRILLFSNLNYWQSNQIISYVDVEENKRKL